MKKNMFTVLLLAFVLVFVVGCTPAANTQDDDKDMMESESMESEEKDMQSDDMDKDDDMSSDEMKDDNDMTEDMAEDDSHEDDMAGDDMKGDDTDKDDGMEMMSEYKDISPEDAKALIDSTPDLVIIDVSPNYAAGHLPGSINYYVGDGSLDAAIPSLDKNVPYLVYCHVDSASISGAQKLIDAGFPMVYRLEGNYSAWVDAGYPIEK